MAFGSVLWDGGDGPPPEATAPDFVRDLHLDQVFAAVTVGREEYNLGPFFLLPADSARGVEARQDVCRDLQAPPVRVAVADLARGMRGVRLHLAESARLSHPLQQAAWLRDAAELYCNAARVCADAFQRLDLRSGALRAWRAHLAALVDSPGFRALEDETLRCGSDLAQVRYTLHIQGRRITVTRAAEEVDYGAAVAATFQRFRQGAAREYRARWRSHPEMNHVEAALLDLVAGLFPETFSALRAYAERHRDFVDPAMGRFDREIQFFVGYLEFVERIQASGLPFALPEVSEGSREVEAEATFDLALARRVQQEGGTVVPNDVRLSGPERALVVSGPNQGGKTTFARAFGQIHHLARLGLPVPGRYVRLPLCDQIFTHFEREEDARNLRGKLQDELIRIRDILQRGTPASLVIMNESFASTTLQDSLFLGTRVLESVIDRGMLCVYVTFVDELSRLGPATVSMVSTVDPENPEVRTYRAVRRPADGRAHAAALAARHGLGYASVRKRVGA